MDGTYFFLLIALGLSVWMSTTWRKMFPLILLFVPLVTSCTSVSKVTDFQGLTTPVGTPSAHVYVSKISVHLFGAVPFLGDSSIKKVFRQFLREAQELNGTQVRVIESNRTHWWSAFPPFTFLFTPVTTTVSGDVFASGTSPSAGV